MRGLLYGTGVVLVVAIALVGAGTVLHDAWTAPGNEDQVQPTEPSPEDPREPDEASEDSRLEALREHLDPESEGDGHNQRWDNRTVAPHNERVIAHVPVAAGYEPTPTPQHCESGERLTGLVYEEDFEGDHGYTFQATPLAPDIQDADPPKPTPNLWNVTEFDGVGTDIDHSSPHRLYFGHTSGEYQGTYEGVNHTAGTAKSPAIELPSAGNVYLTFETKWHVEWLKGYDHLWVEAETPDEEVHLLCTANAYDRTDPTIDAGNTHGFGSCSPMNTVSLCPPVDLERPGSIKLDLPTWETRTVEVPDYLAGETINLRFTFDSADPQANMFLGWMVDDVRVGSQIAGE